MYLCALLDFALCLCLVIVESIGLVSNLTKYVVLCALGVVNQSCIQLYMFTTTHVHVEPRVSLVSVQLETMLLLFFQYGCGLELLAGRQ